MKKFFVTIVLILSTLSLNANDECDNLLYNIDMLTIESHDLINTINDLESYIESSSYNPDTDRWMVGALDATQDELLYNMNQVAAWKDRYKDSCK